MHMFSVSRLHGKDRSEVVQPNLGGTDGLADALAKGHDVSGN